MIDEDFEKVDEDFASEFDFVDAHEGPAASGTAPAAPRPGQGPGPAAPKGTPAIAPLIFLIVVLGGGYYAYTHFFSKSPSVPPPATKPANELPTLPEHGGATQGGATQGEAAPEETPPAAATPPSKADAANAVAEALGQKPPNELTTALPPPTPSGEKSFEQMQKEINSTAPPAAQAQPVVSAEVRSALQNIHEEMTENVNNMRQLEGTIANMATSLDNLNKTISAMDNRVLSLTETVDGLSQDLANVKRVMVDQDLDLTIPGNVRMSASKRQLQTISNSDANYSVHAIIPGRAWLKSASGQIITVTEGDKVGDYGTVAVIDAANGLVRTSSGIIIR